jgi:hypothetical protein
VKYFLKFIWKDSFSHDSKNIAIVKSNDEQFALTEILIQGPSVKHWTWRRNTWKDEWIQPRNRFKCM